MKAINKILVKGEHVCPWWLAYTFDNPLRAIFHKPQQILMPHLQEGMSAVDIGCGMGYFSIAMAKIVGEQGLVIAVDIQQKMLEVLAKRALAKGVRDRIRLHRCEPGTIGLDSEVDFALTFWMVHEVPNVAKFMSEVRSMVKPDGKYLLVEPKFHVGMEKFLHISETAGSVGFQTLERPTITFSRAVLFETAKRK